MPPPNEPVTLSVEQINELNQKVSGLRHDVNNHLAKITAAVELMRLNPQSAERMLQHLTDLPAKISELVVQFSGELETALGLRPPS